MQVFLLLMDHPICLLRKHLFSSNHVNYKRVGKCRKSGLKRAKRCTLSFMLILNNKHLPAKGGDDTMANEFKQLANPKADALLLLSTQVKKIILIVAERVPCPKPKNTLNNTKKE